MRHTIAQAKTRKQIRSVCQPTTNMQQLSHAAALKEEILRGAHGTNDFDTHSTCRRCILPLLTSLLHQNLLGRSGLALSAVVAHPLQRCHLDLPHAGRERVSVVSRWEVGGRLVGGWYAVGTRKRQIMTQNFIRVRQPQRPAISSLLAEVKHAISSLLAEVKRAISPLLAEVKHAKA